MQFSKLSFSACLALIAGITSAAPQSPIKTRQSFTDGEGTVYLQGGAAGSCGTVHSDSDLIVALSNTFMESESPSPYCGRQIQMTNIGSNDGVGGAGNVVTATVADTCPSCDETHVDMSVGAWNDLTGNAPYGTVEINWQFL